MIDLNGAATHATDGARLGRTAMHYATKIGLAVFPCMPSDKPPLDLCDECMTRLPGYAPKSDLKSCRACGTVYEKKNLRGFHLGTTDAAKIERWWAAAPDANIGIATGRGLLVLDVDGTEGEQSLAALLAVHGPLPETPEQTTGKGRHLLFSVDEEVRNTARKLGTGLDTRGDGGYIIVAPSIHPNGKRYEWVAGRSPWEMAIAPAPEWLIAMLVKPKINGRTSTGAQRPDPSQIRDAYVRRAVDDEYQKVATAPTGARNDTINEAAFALGQLVGAGVLDESTARRTLEAAADASGALSDERHKTLGTIERGLAAGIEHPRDLSGVGQRHQERQQNDAHAEKSTGDDDGEKATGDEHEAREPSGEEHSPEDDQLPVPAAWQGVDPAKIPRRRWLYDRYLCRGILSVTISPGGIGKSSLALVEALQMATGRKLHGRALPAGAVRVWYINLEDPPEELDRRLAGVCLHYGITDAYIGGRLFINSGIDTPLKLARLTDRRQARLDEVAFAHLEEQVRANRIDVIIIDPFVSSHEVEESDNGMIDRVSKRLARLAMRCDIAVGLVHHTKKLPAGQEHDADSSRGASALINTARVVRVLNPMTKEEAGDADIRAELRRLYFRASRDKQNLAPPDKDKNWYHMAGVNLGNGTPPLQIDADEVGVAEHWEWPTNEVADKFERAAAERMDTLRRDVLNGMVSCLGPNWAPPREVVARLQNVAFVRQGRQRIIDILQSLANQDGNGTTTIEHGSATIEVETQRSLKRTNHRFRVVRDEG